MRTAPSFPSEVLGTPSRSDPKEATLTAFRTFGVFLIGLGAWGAIVPYVGPTFGYPMPPGSDAAAWEWTASHWQLHLVPGIAAIIGGALMLGAARALVALGGVLALVAGAWFVVGNELAGVWRGGGGGGGGPQGVDAWTVAYTRLGYHDGTGLAMAILAAVALGLLLAAVGRPEPHLEEPVTDEPLRREREREYVT